MFTGVPSATEYLKAWCEKNARRNAAKKMRFNVTGHQSLMILKSLPYSLIDAANLQHINDLTQLRAYLQINYLDDDEILSDIEIGIHWDGLNDHNDVNHEFDESGVNDANDANDVTVVNVGNHDLFNDTGDNDANDDNDDNHDNEVNHEIDELNANDANRDNDDNDVNNVNSNSDIFQLDENIDETMDRIRRSMFDESDEKASQISDSALFNNNNENTNIRYVQTGINLINNTDLQHERHGSLHHNHDKHEANDKRKTSDKINYWYYYTIENDSQEYKLDNNDNEANLYYSRTFNLALTFDYQFWWRLSFCSLKKLKWHKSSNNKCPKDIAKTHIWLRSAVWKAYIFGNWLLTDYSKWVGGIGSYLLETFVHDNPQGYGFYVINQQACEHFGKWIKQNRKSCGSANGDNYLHEIADNFDIYTLGRLLYDMIDMSDVVDDELLKNVTSFNVDEIRKIHHNMLKGSPKLFQMYCNKLAELTVGQPISPCLANIKKRDTDVYTKLNATLRDHMENLVSTEMNDPADDEDDRVKQKNNKRKWRQRYKQSARIAQNIEKHL